MLEQKLAVLTALNVSVDGDGDDKVSFNIFGTNKSIVIDKAKLKEAIMIQDAPQSLNAKRLQTITKLTFLKFRAMRQKRNSFNKQSKLSAPLKRLPAKLSKRNLSSRYLSTQGILPKRRTSP